MTESKEMHPFADYISEKYLEFDRAVVCNLPGIKSFIRYTPNGEFLTETMPWDMTLVQRTKHNGVRFKGQWTNALMPLPTNDDKHRELLVSAPIEGYVYMVKRRNEYKVGRTTNLSQRLSKLDQVFKIEGLCHYILTDNSKRLESILHRAFASVRTGGEWFRLDSDQLSFLQKLLCVFVDTNYLELQAFEAEDSWYPVSSGSERIADLPLLDQSREKEVQSFFPVVRYVPDGWPQKWLLDIPLEELATVPSDLVRKMIGESI